MKTQYPCPWIKLLDECVKHLGEALHSYRYTFQHEIDFQDQLAQVLTEKKIEFTREVELTKRDRVDFLLNYDPYSIAMEVKVGGGINSHLRQMKRYADAGGENSIVDAALLIATKPFQVPEYLSKKPCYCIHINRI